MVASHRFPQFCSSTVPTSFARTGMVIFWDFASNSKVSVVWLAAFARNIGLSFLRPLVGCRVAW